MSDGMQRWLLWSTYFMTGMNASLYYHQYQATNSQATGYGLLAVAMLGMMLIAAVARCMHRGKALLPLTAIGSWVLVTVNYGSLLITMVFAIISGIMISYERHRR